MATKVTKTGESPLGIKFTITVERGWDKVTEMLDADGYKIPHETRHLVQNTRVEYEVDGHTANGELYRLSDERSAIETEKWRKQGYKDVVVVGATAGVRCMMLSDRKYNDLKPVYDALMDEATAEAEQDAGYQEYLAQVAREEEVERRYEESYNKVVRAMELGED